MSNLAELTISEAAAGLRAGKFSARELAEACFKEIDVREGEVNAFITVDKEGALKAADEVDARLAKGEEMGELAGIPVGVKDIFHTKGLKTTSATPILRDFVPPYDSTVVEKLREEGMVMMGKTNLDEFACGSSTEHSHFGVTRNPYDLERVAGGSSGGSAAGLAANMFLYSLGTDTGGSIRLPASFCNIYGLKVTYGRVSRSGVTSLASSFDTIGPFARTPEDIATIMQVIAGPDVRDLTTPKVEVPDYKSFLDKGVKGLKIGLPKEYFSDAVEEETKEIVMDNVKALEKMGAEVVEVSLPTTKYAVAVYYLCMPAELSANLERYDGIRYGKKPQADVDNLVDQYFQARGEGFGDEIKRRIMIGTYALSAGYYDAYYKKAQKVRTLIIEDFAKAFEEVDVLMSPVSPFPAWKVGAMIDDPLAIYISDAMNIPASAAGLAAISCPGGMSKDGLPIGVQVIAPQFGEGLCIQVAEAMRQA